MIKAGTIVTPKEQVRGMIITHNHGDELKVVRVYDEECTIEKSDGTGCISNVPINILEPIKN